MAEVGETLTVTATGTGAKAVADVELSTALPAPAIALTDDESAQSAGVTLSPDAVTLAEDGTATYTVVLDAAPSANVTVTPASGDTARATVSGALTFTTANWDTPQTVTVTGVDDPDGDDNTVTITHGVDGVGSGYDFVTAGSVTAKVTDTDTVPRQPAAPTVAPLAPTALHVEWTAPDSTGRPAVSNYDAQYCETGDDGACKQASPLWTDGPQDVTGTDADITGLTADTGYLVRVRASNPDGDGAWSQPTAASTPAVAAGSTATIASLSVASTPAEASTYAQGEKIVIEVEFATTDAALVVLTLRGTRVPYLAIDVGGAEKRAVYTGVDNTSAVSDGKATASFSYTVQAGDADADGISVGAPKLHANGATIATKYGAASLAHSELAAQSGHKVDADPPAKPAGLNAAAGHERVRLTWDAPSPADASIAKWQYAYKQGSSAYGAWTDMDPSSATTTAYTVKGLDNDTAYTFKIRAHDAVNEGPESDEATATPVPTDVSVSLVLSPAVVSEDGGVSAVTAVLSEAVDADVVVTVSAAAVSPAVSADFSLSADKTLTIAAGQTASTGTVTITAVDNSEATADKAVTVSGTPSGAAVNGPADVTLTIADDDAPRVSLVLSPGFVSEDGGVSAVTAVLSEAVDADVVVTVSAAAVSPAVSADFSLSADKTLTIAKGETASTGTVTITAVDNSVSAANKAVTVSGATAASGVNGPVDVALTVVEDDYSCAGIKVFGANASEDLVADCEALLASRDVLAGSASLNWSTDVSLLDWDGLSFERTSNGPTRLRGVNLEGESLDGGIPDQLGDLSSLFHLYVNDNDLSGPIPAALGGLSTLGRLRLDGNGLSGPIPTELGSLTGLFDLWLGDNDLSGPIPAWLGDLSVLEELRLDRSGLSGAIPTELGDLSALKELGLSGNELSGAIPTDLGGLSALELLWLHDNDLSGAIPEELAALSAVGDLRLWGNDLSGEVTLSVSPTEATEDGGSVTVTVTATLDAGTAWANKFAHPGPDGDLGEADDNIAATSTVTVSVAGSSVAGAVDFAAVADFDITIPNGDADASGTFTLTPTNDSDEEVDETITVTATGTGAKDVADATLSSAAPAPTITLTDDDNAPPVFSSPESVSVAENQTSVVTVAASDADSSDTVTDYEITGGADAALFSIVSSSGVLTFKSAPDYESPQDTESTTPQNAAANNQYVVVVTATSGDRDRAMTADQTITVTVTNVDEPGSVSFDSDTPTVAAELTAELDDPDGSVSAVTWQWASADAQDGTYTDITGATSAAYTPAATDAAKWLRATAGYTDGHGSGKTAAATAAAAVAAAGQKPPAAPTGLVARGVGQTGIDLWWKAPATASDRAAATGYEVQWSADGSSNWTALATISDAATVTHSDTGLAAETTRHYRVRATSDPGAGAWSATDSATTTTYAFGLSVSPSTLLETDFSGSQTKTVTIDLTLSGAWSDEDGDINLGWAGSGGGGYRKVFESHFGPERCTAVAAGLAEFQLEGAPAGLTVTDATRLDACSSASTAPKTVTLALSGTLDQPSYTVTVRVTRKVLSFGDATGSCHQNFAPKVCPETLKATFQLRQAVTVSATEVSVEEGGSAGTYTVKLASKPTADVTVTPTSPDTGAVTVSTEASDNTLTFTASNWSTAQTVTVTPVDDDDADDETVTVSHTVTGAGSGYESVSAPQVTVNVADDEAANAGPVFSSPTTVSVAENQTSVVTVTAADADSGDSVTGYSITGGADQSKFSINSSSGVLTFASAPDYESPQDAVSASPQNAAGNNQYVVVVTATSGTNDRVKTADQTIVVTVTNVDEAGSVSFDSDTPAVGDELTAELDDPDGSVSSVTWQWASADAQDGTFADISGATSAAYMPAAGDAGKWLRATASYTDGHGSGKSAAATAAAAVSAKPKVTLVLGASSINESGTGNSTTLKATLPSAAPSAITVSLTADPSAAVSFGAASVEIPANGTESATVTVTAVDNKVDAPDASVKISGAVTATAVTAPDDVTLTVVDDDTKGVTVSATEVSVDEGGAAGTYTVKLTSEPTADVTVTPASGDTGAVTVSTAASDNTLTFTASNWSTAQTVTVTPVDDDDADDETVIVSHMVTGAGSGYESVSAPQVTVNVADDDEANAGPVFSSSTTVSVAENQTSVVTVTAADADSGDSVTGYSISGGADQSKFSINASSGVLTFKSAPDFESPEDVLSTTPSNAAGDNEYVVVVTATSGTGTRVKTADQTIVVTVTNVEEAGSVSFDSDTPTVSEALTASLDDPDGSVSSVTWQWARADAQDGTFADITSATSAAYTPAATDAGKWLRATASYTDGHGSGKTAAATAADAVSAKPKVSLVLGASSINESGSGNSTTVKATLPSAAPSAVTVSLSADPSAAVSFGASSVEIPANGTESATVSVTAVDNEVDAPDASVKISGAVSATAVTGPDDVTLTVVDDDTKGVTVSATEVSVDEGGSAGSYTVKLDSEPTADVTVTPASGDTGAVTVSGALTFTASNWSTAQTVTVTPVDDDDADDETVAVSHTVAGAGSGYGRVSAASVTVKVDDDEVVPLVCAGSTATPAGSSAGLVSDCDVLLASKDGLRGSASLNWSNDLAIGSWEGVTLLSDADPSVTAAADRVFSLDVNGENFAGSLPPELGGLSALRLLAVRNTAMTGGVPAAVGDLSSLQQLLVQNNPSMTGGIDAAVGRLSGLVKLIVQDTPLTGPIPSHLGSLDALEALVVDDTGLTGPLPSELGGLSKLKQLAVVDTAVTGAIPTQLGSLGALEELTLANTSLSGSIPAQLGGLSSLERLIVVGNTGLTGSIPSQLGSLSKLEELVLVNNTGLTGTIPSELGNLSVLERLLLSNMELTGSLPAKLGDLSKLKTLAVSHTTVTGAIPAEMGKLTALQGLDLTANKLTGAIPADLVPSAPGVDPATGLQALKHLDLRANKLTGAVTLSVDPATVAEGAGDTTVTVTATLDAGTAWANRFDLVQVDPNTNKKNTFPARSEVTVTVAGSGEADAVDFTAVADFTITIPKGQTTATGTFTLTPTDDSDEEDDETITVSVAAGAKGAVNIANATLTTAGDEPTITLTDDDEEAANAAPVFSSSASVSVAENQTSVVTVAASDADSGDSVTGYSISGGVDQSKFSIVSSSGVLTFASAPDYESPEDVLSTTPSNAAGNNVYVVVVRATSGSGDRVMTADQTIVVTVTNVEEAGSVSFDSDTPTVGDALTASLDDPDGSVSSVTWQWARADAQDGTFADISAATSAAYTPVAGDAGKWLRATASYTDGHGSGKTAAATAAAAVSAKPKVVLVLGVSSINESGSGNSTTVKATLPSAASSAITVSLSADPSSAVSFGAASVEIPANGTQSPTVSVTAVDNEVDAADAAVKISGAVSATAVTGPDDVTLTVVDDDTKGVTVSVTSVSVTEGGTAGSYTVKLDSEPTASVTVTPASGDTGAVTVSAALTFTASNWSTAQTVTVTPVSDDDDDNETVTVSHTVTGNGSGYEMVTAADVTVNVADDDEEAANAAPVFSSSASVSVAENQTSVVTVAASDADSGDSVTGYSISGGVDQSKFSIVSSSGVLTFASAPDYESPEDVLSTTPSNAAGNNVYVVVVRATSGSGDRVMTADQTIVVTVTNVEEAGSVSFDSDTPTVGDALTASLDDPDGSVSSVTWQWARADAQDGTFADISAATSAAYTPVAGDAGKWLRATASYTDGHGSGKTAAATAAAAVSAKPKVVLVLGVSSINESGSGNSTTVKATLPSAASSAITVSLSADPSAAVSFGAASVEIPANGTQSPTVSVTAVDNEVDAADAAVKISGAVSATAVTGPDDVTLTVVDDDTKGVTVSVTSVSVTEGGTAGSYTVKLDSEPTADVTVTPASGDTGAVTVSAALTFTASNWSTAQTVTVTPVSDDDDDNETVTVSHTVTGNGSGYEMVTAADVTVNVADDDEEAANAAPVFSSSASVSVAENQTSVVTVAASDADSGDSVTGYSISGGVDQSKFSIVSSSGVLTFASAPDYESPEDVLSTTPSNAAGNNVYVVVVRATSGSGDRVMTADQTIVVTVTNVEEAGSVSFDSDTPTVGDALTASLDDPDGSVSSVTWQWARADAQDGTFADISAATSAAYTPVAGDAGKWLRATASYTDGHGSGKTAAATAAAAVSAKPKVVLVLGVSSINESGSGNSTTVKATLPSAASSAITVSLSADPSSAVSFGAASVEIPANGTQSPTVSVTAVDNEVDAADAAVKISGAVSATAVTGPDDVTLTVVDDDTKGVTVSVTSVSVTEGGTAGSYTVKLDSEPTASVTVTPASGDTGAVTVSAALTFTASNWSTAQTVTVTPVSDDDDDNETVTVSHTVTGNGSGYEMVTAADVTVNVADDDEEAANAAPVFSSSASVSVAENQTSVVTVAASDADSGDSVTGYSISGGVDQSKFSIVSSSGVLTFASAPDYESPEDVLSTTPSNAAGNNVYVVVVRATSGSGDRVMTADQTIVVTVTNVEEAGSVSFDSDTPTVGDALTASLDDPDGSVSSVTWQWARADAQDGTFADISAATSAAYTPVAGDAGKWLRATASYTDGHGSGKTAAATAAAAVSAKPKVVLVLGVSSINESGSGNSTTVKATLPSAASSAITVSLSADPSSAVSFGAASVEIPANGTQSPTVSVTAVDNEVDAADAAVKISGAVSATAVTGPDDVTLTVVDDDTKGVTVSVTSVSVTEGGTAGSYTVKLDSEPTASVTVTPASGDTGAVTVSAALTFTASNWSTAQTVTVTPVSDDDDDNETVTVSHTVTGNGSGYEMVTAADVTVNVADDDEEAANAAPVFSSSASVSVAENQTSVVTVAASDADSGDSVTGYSISGGVDQSKFSIVSSSGVLTFASAPDYESPEDVLSTTPSNAAGNNVYVVVVRATSGSGDRVMTADQTIVVTVTNVEEAGSVSFDSDTPTVGDALTASLDDPDGSVSSVTWQWARADAQDGTFADISAATSAAYTPVAGDAGKWLRATASYTDGHGSGKTAAATAAAAVSAKPKVTLPQVRLVLGLSQIPESGVGSSTLLWATLPEAVSQDVTVTLGASPAGRVGFSASTLVIPANGTRSGDVTVTAVDNSTEERNTRVSISGSVTSSLVAAPAAVRIVVLDDDAPVPERGSARPEQVLGLSASGRDRKVVLSWDRALDQVIDRYEYRMRVGADGEWSAWSLLADAPEGSGTPGIFCDHLRAAEMTSCELSWSDDVNGTEYAFKVRAVNSEANAAGPASATVKATPVGSRVPERPRALTASPGDARVALLWQDPLDESIGRYQYRYRISGGRWGRWSEIYHPDGLPAFASTTHMVDGLANGTAYEFTIRARNSDGWSRPAKAVKATPVTAASPPAAVTVPPDWPLIPSGLGPGDSFRLLFATGATTAVSTAIGDYNAFAQRHATGELFRYRHGVRAVISTAATDAYDNLGARPGDGQVVHREGEGVPVYWTGGALVADGWRSFFFGHWSDTTATTAAGTPAGHQRFWTGSIWGYSYLLITKRFYAGAPRVQLGSLSPGANPIAVPDDRDHIAPKTASYPLYAITQIFTVARQ